MNNTICLIPSRLSSRRLPGKALLEIRGVPLIIHELGGGLSQLTKLMFVLIA